MTCRSGFAVLATHTDAEGNLDGPARGSGRGRGVQHAARTRLRPGGSRESRHRGGVIMGRRIGVATILGLIYGLSSPATRAGDGQEGHPRPLILAHYMPW